MYRYQVFFQVPVSVCDILIVFTLTIVSDIFTDSRLSFGQKRIEFSLPSSVSASDTALGLLVPGTFSDLAYISRLSYQ